MTSFKLFTCILVLLVAIIYRYYPQPSKLPFHIDGHVDRRFINVRNVFSDILKTERDGAALAVYYRGKLVVDLWGGYADSESARKWQSDTMSVVYSSTKAVGALLLAMLVHNGAVAYDDLVSKYWPEFGTNGGRDNVTVGWLVGHKTGLIAFDRDFTLDDAHNPDVITQLIEQARPYWPPGTRSGYHAITYGWLVDQIVRRVDDNRRSAGQFYRDEVWPCMQDKDFYIGVPKQLQYRIARITQSTMWQSIFDDGDWSNIITNFIFNIRLRWFCADCWMIHALTKPTFLSIFSDRISYNNPYVQQLEQVASLGIGTARGLASVFDTAIGRHLIADSVLDRILQPNDVGIDAVLQVPILKGHGFFYVPHPNNASAFLFGHSGHGGQLVEVDWHNHLSWAFIRNGLKPFLSRRPNSSTSRLRSAIFESIITIKD